MTVVHAALKASRIDRQTYSTCSSAITPENGSASPRRPRSSVTGKSPSRQPKR